MDIILIAAEHFYPVSNISDRFIPYLQEYERWDSWEALADRISQFISTFGHEEIKNTILNPFYGYRIVIWKANDGKYYKIVFKKVIQDDWDTWRFQIEMPRAMEAPYFVLHEAEDIEIEKIPQNQLT